MGKTYVELDEELSSFMARQHVFFVGTAPLQHEGLVNISPKGLHSFVILDPGTIAYVDVTGSGIETVANLRENGRIVVMFCAFEGAPRILRLYGRGTVLEAHDPGFEELMSRCPPQPGIRAIIRVALTRIADSCGYGVPLMRFEQDRDQLTKWTDKKQTKDIRAYRREKNRIGLNGLPGLLDL